MKQFFSLTRNTFAEFWKSSAPLKAINAGKSRITAKKPVRCTHRFYPETMLCGLEVKTRFVPGGPEPLMLELSPYGVIIDAAGHFSYITRSNMSNYCKNSTKLLLQRGRTNTLMVTYDRGRVQVKLNDQPALTFKSTYRPNCDQLSIEWPSQTTIKALTVKGRPLAKLTLPKKSHSYAYHATIDFPDDLVPAPYNQTLLRRMMTRLAELGFTRVYWIYYGGKEEGFWRAFNRDCFIPSSHIEQTQKNVGDDFLRAAVTAAHRAGLEIHAVIKPFDFSHNATLALSSTQPLEPGRSELLGGQSRGEYRFVADHPGCCLRARPLTSTSRHPIERVVLESAHVPEMMPDRVVVWTSNDNHRFRPLGNEYSVKIHRKRITISGLGISEPYVAIQVPGVQGRNCFINTQDRLFRAYDRHGNPIEMTYGLAPRMFKIHSGGEGNHMDYVGSTLVQVGGDFPEDGFFFDYWPGVPSSLFCGDKTLLEGLSLDNEYGVLGMARGRNKFVPGVMCPSHRAARGFWLTMIGQALDHGVDGIDIRRMHHSNTLRYGDYGFNPPVIREFRKRYGVDVTREPFDMGAWRKLRGEYYARFLREAGNVVRKRGKTMQVHISDILEGAPDVSAAQEIYCDWKSWITEGLCDEVTFKAGNLDVYRRHMGIELINLCQKEGIPIYYCPFVHRVAGVTSRKDWKSFLSRDLPASGMNGFVLYETADLLYAAKGNRIKDRDPELVEHISRIARAT